MKLVKPDKKYLQSYYEACIETWGHVHDNYILHNPELFESWKNHIFEDYEQQEKGINLPLGFVPSVTFLAVDGDNYIGTVNIRPKLNERLKEYGGHIGIVIRNSCRKKGYGEKFVRMAVKKAYTMGIKELLLTCEETNVPSQKIIEKFEAIRIEKDKVMLNGKTTLIRRYYLK